MSKTVVKLQNLILQHDADANIRSYVELMHKSSKPGIHSVIYDAGDNCHIIQKYDVLDFATYFNSLQAADWKKHTAAEHFKLKLIYKGKGTLEISEYYRSSKNINCSSLLTMLLDSGEKTEITIDIPDTEKPLVGFSITALEEFRLYGGAYLAEVDSEAVRDIRLSMVSTTFKKEEYITRNIALLKEKALCEGSDLEGHLSVKVIDNGRTLDAESLSGSGITVMPNANVGGAGGFTRGMIESLSDDPKPTHVLLMDDDVMIMPESLFRTYYLLRIVKPEYYGSFISGAMFDYDIREMQYEDVGYVHVADGSYGPLKSHLDMRGLGSLLDNEKMEEKSKNNSYAGWWFCCIPMTAIEQNGLPLPVFVRGDDVEFSLRNNADFITINGICIWHVGFAGKFNAAMELYQVHRNSLIIQAASGICSDVDFIKRLKPMFWKELTRFAYNNAEQITDSIEDFMRGPEFLKSANGEEIMKAHAAKNDKLLPIEEFPPEYNIKKGDPYSYKRLNLFKKLVYAATINGHLLPGFMLRNWPEIIAYDWFFVPGKNFRRKRLIAVNPNDNTACMRVMNRRKCFAAISRYRKVMKNYKKHHKAVEDAYRKAFPELVSEKFWKEYLGI